MELMEQNLRYFCLSYYRKDSFQLKLKFIMFELPEMADL